MYHRNNLSSKKLANHEKMVYAFLRYPISVSHTVLVQGKNPTLVGGKRLVTSAKDMDPEDYQHITQEVPS